MAVVVAVDAGTTGVRAVAVDEDGAVAGWAYRELTQHYPRPGWVEHGAEEIWGAVEVTLAELRGSLRAAGHQVAAIGVTNQRETVVAWDRRTGQPLHRAIVWQDRRTAAACDAQREAGHLPLVRRTTGLVLDPYFSATKMAWLLSEGGVAESTSLALGTVDAWLVWNLTGGTASGVFTTDPSNASRTLLYDIGARAWSGELCDLFGVPLGCLPEVAPSSGRLGTTPEGVPVSGVAGDQQAALFGQACLSPGMCKATYGTGTFVLMNVGATCPEPADGLLTSVAWELSDGTVAYVLEGAVFATGAAVQWLRDGLGIIGGAGEVEALAASVPDTGGVVVVPAFAGLGQPVVGRLGPGRGRRPHPRYRAVPPGPGRSRVDRPPDPRRDRCHGLGRRPPGGRPAGGRGRGSKRPAAAAGGRPVQRHRGPAGGNGGHHRPRRRLPGRPGRGCLGVARRRGRRLVRGALLRPPHRAGGPRRPARGVAPGGGPRRWLGGLTPRSPAPAGQGPSSRRGAGANGS